MDVPGYEGLYQVSNLGRIKALDRIIAHAKGFGNRVIKGTIMSLSIPSKGYITITLSKNGKKKWCRPHQLVAKVFIPNPLNLPEINHKDENKLNNHVDNLEWCTRLYNIRYGTGIKRRRDLCVGRAFTFGESVWCSKLKEHQVIEIYKSPLSHSELSKIYKIERSAITNIKNKKRWKQLLNNL